MRCTGVTDCPDYNIAKFRVKVQIIAALELHNTPKKGGSSISNRWANLNRFPAELSVGFMLGMQRQLLFTPRLQENVLHAIIIHPRLRLFPIIVQWPPIVSFICSLLLAPSDWKIIIMLVMNDSHTA